MATAVTEKRQFRRVPLEAWVEVEAGGKLYRFECRNISIGGMLLRGDETLRENETFRMKFALPGSPQPLTVTGIVQHVSPEAFMGVRFEGIADEARAAIERFVNQSPPSTK